MAVHGVLGGELAWVADNDPGAAKILACRFPSAPNLGDITAVDWAGVEPVDVVTAGFPCQDLSYAGRGEGIKEGNRSGLWYTVANAIGTLRPGLVMLENVAGIVARRPGLDVVLASLASLGFDAEWTCVRASDAGAPHGRNRWFCLAWPADANGAAVRRERPWRGPGPVQGTEVAGRTAEQPGRLHSGDGSGRAVAAADAGRGGRDGWPFEPQRGPLSGTAPAGNSEVALNWRQYTPAIRRWEHILGRPAPRPTEPGRTGQRLSPRFAEWMMGLPEGWVTGVPGLSRNAQLKALGNGVVPQQAAAALRLLLAPARETARAAR